MARVPGSHALPPSAKQLQYIRDLYTQAAQNAAVLGTSDETQEDMVERLMNRLGQSSMHDVSRAIDAALAGLRNQRSQIFGKRYADKQRTEVEDGMYALSNNVYIKIIRAVHGSGHQYAKLWQPETSTWEMLRGGVKLVARSGTRMTVDDAKRFGALYGQCCVCGRMLTNEESIKDGIGPICEGRL